jgi:hypothetical protein
MFGAELASAGVGAFWAEPAAGKSSKTAIVRKSKKEIFDMPPHYRVHDRSKRDALLRPPLGKDDAEPNQPAVLSLGSE